ncbi:MAG: DUF4179 domain-containing protein [Sphingobacterium sp.]|nr:DUF4179 domain-containing protein [Sphingobacterium sp.]
MLKRKFEETKLPLIHLEPYVLEQINKEPQRQQNNRFYQKKLLVACGSVMAFMVLFWALSSFPAAAEQLRKIPIIGKIFDGTGITSIGDPGLIDGKENGLAIQLNQEAINQGTTIKMQDAIYDGARLSISCDIKTEHQVRSVLEILQNGIVKINGEVLPAGKIKPMLRILDEKHAIGLININIDSLQPIRSFDLKLQFSGENLENGSSLTKNNIEGEWDFNLPITNRALNDSQSKILANAYTSKSSDGQFQITSYMLTPITTRIDFNYTGKTEFLYFALQDDRGMLSNIIGSDYTTDENGVTKGSLFFNPLANGTKSISVTPYLYTSREIFENAKPIGTTFPIELQLKDVGKIIINQIDKLEDRTLVYYKIEGDQPYLLADSVHFITRSGRHVYSNSLWPLRTNDTSYEYVQEFPPLDPAEQYNIGSMIQIDAKLLSDLTIKLDLAK